MAIIYISHSHSHILTTCIGVLFMCTLHYIRRRIHYDLHHARQWLFFFVPSLFVLLMLLFAMQHTHIEYLIAIKMVVENVRTYVLCDGSACIHNIGVCTQNGTGTKSNKSHAYYNNWYVLRIGAEIVSELYVHVHVVSIPLLFMMRIVYLLYRTQSTTKQKKNNIECWNFSGNFFLFLFCSCLGYSHSFRVFAQYSWHARTPKLNKT